MQKTTQIAVSLCTLAVTFASALYAQHPALRMSARDLNALLVMTSAYSGALALLATLVLYHARGRLYGARQAAPWRFQGVASMGLTAPLIVMGFLVAQWVDQRGASALVSWVIFLSSGLLGLSAYLSWLLRAALVKATWPAAGPGARRAA